jgi:catechol 2,3-dioxygenase-like lactoylglutathione lyase family enzyme
MARPLVPASGQCACGAVSYAIELDRTAALCHCDTCRRASGAAGIAWSNGSKGTLRLTGPTRTWRSSTHASRVSCSACGSPLFCQEDAEPDVIEVAIGSLHDPGVVRRITHSFVHRRPPWDDGSPGFAHLQIGARDIVRLVAFYDSVLPLLGWRRQVDVADAGAAGVFWRLPGRRWPQFVIDTPFDRAPASVGNGTQVSFFASRRALVDQAWNAALAAGASDEGAPGLRPRYAQDFHAAYCRDPEGHKLCFVHTADSVDPSDTGGKSSGTTAS